MFEDFRYTEEPDGDGVFGARIGDRSLQRIDFLRLDPSTQTAESTVVIRPASGLIALAGRLG